MAKRTNISIIIIITFVLLVSLGCNKNEKDNDALLLFVAGTGINTFTGLGTSTSPDAATLDFEGMDFIYEGNGVPSSTNKLYFISHFALTANGSDITVYTVKLFDNADGLLDLNNGIYVGLSDLPMLPSYSLGDNITSMLSFDNNTRSVTVEFDPPYLIPNGERKEFRVVYEINGTEPNFSDYNTTSLVYKSKIKPEDIYAEVQGVYRVVVNGLEYIADPIYFRLQ